jgi:hypothetical protein
MVCESAVVLDVARRRTKRKQKLRQQRKDLGRSD